ncbi:MAG TPA: condensation domain-containing protein, partial [Longimicrobiaceae bacterium]|nr:condensation domain-containing protein [Longimicrobiaceae bacterium]
MSDLSARLAQLPLEKRIVLQKMLRDKAAAAGGGRRRIARVERDGPLPLSFAQQRLWFLHQLDPASRAYSVPVALWMRGTLDVAALDRSLREIISRHEVLRTVFAESDGEPVQVVRPQGAVELPVVDLAGLPGASREAELGRLAAAHAHRPFDLRRGPLMRVMLVRVSPGDTGLLFNLHHIISDAWSAEVLVREVSTLYEGHLRGEARPLPELPVQYADFAAWQRKWLQGEVLEEQIGFWRERLRGAPPVLEIPTDRVRSATPGDEVARSTIVLPPELVGDLQALSEREGATLFMTLLGAWKLLLSRYSGQEDVVVGPVVAGRGRAEVEGLIGFFVNTLVLRTDLSGDPTVRELVRRARETTLGAFSHQELPFERLVKELQPERVAGRNPFFEVMFSLDQASGEAAVLELGDVRLSTLEGGRETAKFDLSLTFSHDGGALLGTLAYRESLYEAATIERLAGHLAVVLEEMAGEPGRRLSELSLLRGAERTQVLEEWNRTERPYPREVCIHERFEAQVRERPGATALVWEGVELTYAELDARANRLAHHLAGLGVGPERGVGVLLERGVELIVSILAVLKAGGCYVPLDPSYPAERLELMLADSAAAVLLSRSELSGALAGSDARAVCLDTAAEALGRAPVEAPRSGARAQNLAYIVYTSGSTGRPKGGMVAHRHVVQLVCDTDYVRFRPGDRIAQGSNASFDALTFEAWGALLNGATLVGIDRDVLLSPAALRAFLAEERITTLYQTTALLNQVAREQPGIFA